MNISTSQPLSIINQPEFNKKIQHSLQIPSIYRGFGHTIDQPFFTMADCEVHKSSLPAAESLADVVHTPSADIR